ncbi:MAG: nicotinate (nicotinamide) nucleotide adenylyltransferase, partial [Lachnospiraceae bacterium]|nr:nicotinate (nicotinamide) nucleotide adenylyltransferase [Lachnospiraceae bacterium]
MRRIGIMGGTFNPIHNGHLAIAGKAREQFFLEKILFMPSGVPYTKDLREVLPVDIRCEMTALAIADTPYFELSMLEAEDAEQGKNTYTFETLQKLRHADPTADYYFILGADSLYAIENWKKPELIFENCTLLAAMRIDESPIALQRDISFAQEKLY